MGIGYLIQDLFLRRFKLCSKKNLKKIDLFVFNFHLKKSNFFRRNRYAMTFYLISFYPMAFLSNDILSNNSLSNNNFKTGLPIANVPFPSVVICTQGINMDGIRAASIKLAFDYAKKISGKSTKVLPLQLLNFVNEGVRETVICFEKLYFHIFSLPWYEV